jgi:hypothetical protein
MKASTVEDQLYNCTWRGGTFLSDYKKNIVVGVVENKAKIRSKILKEYCWI